MQQSTGVKQVQKTRLKAPRVWFFILVMVTGLLGATSACRNKGTTVVRPAHHHRYYKPGKDRRTRRTRTVRLRPVHGKAPKPPKKKEPKAPKGTKNDSTMSQGDALQNGAMPADAMPDSIPAPY